LDRAKGWQWTDPDEFNVFTLHRDYPGGISGPVVEVNGPSYEGDHYLWFVDLDTLEEDYPELDAGRWSLFGTAATLADALRAVEAAYPTQEQWQAFLTGREV
jgi:hypothetical protein